MRRLFFILMCLGLVSLSQAVIIKIEAEDANWWYQSGNWSTVADAAASGGSYITAIVNGTTFNPAYSRLYSFPLDAGTFTLYARVNMSNVGGIATNDSMYITDSFVEGDVDGYVTFNNVATGIEGISLNENWGWVQIGADYVMSVDGTAYFWASTREDGLRVDAFAFVTKGQTVTNAELTASEAYNPEGPYDPVVAPENEDGSVGTLEYDGQYQVSDVVLGFKAGKDLTGTYAVNPNILRHNIWLQSGLPADANMILIDTLTQVSLDDPNQSTGTTVPLVDNTTFQWRVEQVLDNGAGGYPDGDPNNIWGSLWSFTTASAVPVIESISDELTTDTSGNGTIEIVVTPIGDHYQWFKVVGEQDSPENGETNDIKLLDSDPLYEGTTTTTLQVTGAASDGSDDAQVYAIAYYGVPGQPTTEASEPSPSRWFWYPRLMAHYPFESVTGDITPDTASGYDMQLLSGDAGLDLPSLNTNVPVAPGLASTKSLLFNNAAKGDPNTWAQYAAIAEPTIGRYRNITVSAWVYYRGGLFNQRIIDFGEQDNWIYITPQSDGNVLLLNVIGQTVTAPTITNNEWTHIAATLQGDTGKLYVNGQWVASAEITNDPISIGTAGMNNYVGRSNNPDDAYLNGYIDDLKIFNYGLTSEQVGLLYLDDTLQDTVCELETFDFQEFDINDNCLLDLPDLLELISRWLEDDRIYPAP